MSRITSVIYPYCQKVLPLVYDDSLSYYESICKLVLKVNEVIDTFNGYEEIIEQLSQELVDIESVKDRVTVLESSLNGINSELTNVNAKIAMLGQKDEQLQRQIEELTNSVNNVIYLYNSLRAYVDNAIQTVKIDNTSEWINFQVQVNSTVARLSTEVAQLRELVNQIGNDVYNPIRGVRENLDNNNQDVYNDLRYGGMTNAERLAFGGTNEALMSKVLDNRDLAINGRMRCKMHWIYSTITGRRTPHYNAVALLSDLVTDGLTNNEFVALDLTNDEVIALDLTNLEKYLYNPSRGSYVMHSSDAVGLTNEEMTELYINN